MAGKQAKVLTRRQVRRRLIGARRGRDPERDRVMILLSVKAVLRAGEIAKLKCSMALDKQNAGPCLASLGRRRAALY